MFSKDLTNRLERSAQIKLVAWQPDQKTTTIVCFHAWFGTFTNAQSLRSFEGNASEDLASMLCRTVLTDHRESNAGVKGGKQPSSGCQSYTEPQATAGFCAPEPRFWIYPQSRLR